jgi:hypothetical protein
MSADAAHLLTDDSLRGEMGRAARRSAVTRYSTATVIPQYIEFMNASLQSEAVTSCQNLRITHARITNK